MTSPEANARTAAAAFAFPAAVGSVAPLGRGLINDTWLATLANGGRAVLQQLNRSVFPAPERIAHNLRLLHEHAARRPAVALRLPAPIPTRDGSDLYIDATGAAWRALDFLEHTRTLATLDNAAQAMALGSALGRFHALVDDLDPARLQVTLPGFHVLSGYLAAFDAALAGLGATDATLDQALAFVAARRDALGAIEAANRDGRLRARVTHGDPKLDNVLFDEAADEAVALIDLDTVQPGLIHHDVGDCLRSACNRAGESPADPAAVHFDLDIATAILRGYLGTTRGMLTRDDVALLGEAIRLLPFELGLRFLTDHLNGDRYFKVARHGDNLHRARVQFGLCADVERQQAELESVIRKLTGMNF